MEMPLRLLSNLGPAAERMLNAAGIFSEAELRAIGSVGAYLAVKKVAGKASLNLLWALEGALTNRHWCDVARTERAALLLVLDAHDQLRP